jgi:two-component system C4-dicarboxylate transport sensor histidine kinase DctB
MLAFDRRLKTITLEATLSNDSGVARLNTHAMEQVLANLYRNALDAVESSPLPRLRVSTHGDNGSCIIEVSDNGNGIAPEHLTKIFEPFFTTKPAGLGTGLGLSISAKFVREHGGRLEVHSTLGQGTTFTIRIPRNMPLADPATVSSGPSRTTPINTTVPSGATP